MARHYAVLWSLDYDQSVPIGIAVESADHVLVDVPDHIGIPARYRDPYEVIQPDSSTLIYRPGDPGYFDQVLFGLSQMLAVGERGVIADDSSSDVIDLLREKILKPMTEATAIPDR